jgi:hypothetical protein
MIAERGLRVGEHLPEVRHRRTGSAQAETHVTGCLAIGSAPRSGSWTPVSSRWPGRRPARPCAARQMPGSTWTAREAIRTRCCGALMSAVPSTVTTLSGPRSSTRICSLPPTCAATSAGPAPTPPTTPPARGIQPCPQRSRLHRLRPGRLTTLRIGNLLAPASREEKQANVSQRFPPPGRGPLHRFPVLRSLVSPSLP